jgi:hypothetical protein
MGTRRFMPDTTDKRGTIERPRSKLRGIFPSLWNKNIFIFARYPQSKLRGMRSLSDSTYTPLYNVQWVAIAIRWRTD